MQVTVPNLQFKLGI